MYVVRPVVGKPGNSGDVANQHGSYRAIFDYTIAPPAGQRARTHRSCRTPAGAIRAIIAPEPCAVMMPRGIYQTVNHALYTLARGDNFVGLVRHRVAAAYSCGHLRHTHRVQWQAICPVGDLRTITLPIVNGTAFYAILRRCHGVTRSAWHASAMRFGRDGIESVVDHVEGITYAVLAVWLGRAARGAYVQLLWRSADLTSISRTVPAFLPTAPSISAPRLSPFPRGERLC